MMRHIHAEGPYPIQDHDGDEIPEWAIGICEITEHDCSPVGSTWYVRSYAKLETIAANMARDRRLPIEWDASRP